ncbi:hypothetical protein [Flavobacterium cerinum]|uniref:Uncharacterized protein n=1 Tax=Flavobacterium cerinum TaxID=2502784 RepID=A0A444HC18_9FLAO|nr:hypothetical protein [Flavobacterium cerinum]RWX00917.1 hypothetical protein EPI11_07805 [Flavobacterium cerinum]
MAKDQVFESNPTISVYYKTSDGETFYKEGDAKFHARSLKDKSVQTVTKGTEAAASEGKDKDAKPAKAEDLIKLIQAATTLEALDEFKNDTRSTVLKAIEAKTAELTPVHGAEILKNEE